MKKIQVASENLDRQLAGLNSMTRIWLDKHFEKIGVKDDNNERVRLRDLEQRLRWPLEHLIHAAHFAEGITTRGPQNIALWVMIERLADVWEICHGKPPTTDKGRRLKNDPFLALCQEMAGIAHARLKVKGGGLGSLSLAGIVDNVLTTRSSRTAEKPREK